MYLFMYFYSTHHSFWLLFLSVFSSFSSSLTSFLFRAAVRQPFTPQDNRFFSFFVSLFGCCCFYCHTISPPCLFLAPSFQSASLSLHVLLPLSLSLLCTLYLLSRSAAASIYYLQERRSEPAPRRVFLSSTLVTAS